jgi:hypothetical protein
MKKLITLIVAVLMATSLAFGQLFINEIDYDQPGTDAYEFFELAGPAGTYTNVVVDLINGTNPAVPASYKTITLGNITLSNESDGYGFYVVGVAAVENVDFVITPNENAIQNGAPDGIQLSVNGTIVDGVAYEGALNDLSGNPMEDVDSFGEDMYEGLADTSISRVGLDGSPWVVTSHTPGAINTGQNLAAGTNYDPVADAGPDQLVMINTTVTLDGSGSSDPNDNIEAYLWTQVGGTTVTLGDASAVTTTFTAPGATTDLLFELTVTDSAAAVDKDTVLIEVREPQDSKLIISEYIDGTSSNKAVELYNLDSNSVDLSGYVVKLAGNGGDWNYEVALTGTLEGHDVYVITNDQAAATEITSNSDVTSNITWFNGNDALGLFLNDVLVDVIGVQGENPGDGAGWSVAGVTNGTMDHTLIRKPSVEAPTTNWAAAAGTNADNSEWIVQEYGYYTDLGSHTAGPVAYSFANAAVTTDFPQAGSEISISVDITPDEGVSAPSSVKVWYGFDGTQANSADMWLESGNTYAGAIPALSQGDKALDYYISATGNGETVNSALYSMIIAGTLTDISDIHTNIATYDGELKTIEGVITIGAGVLRDDRTSCYIQDESGRGLNLYNSSEVLSDLTRGTKVKLVGTVTPYYTTVEIENFTYTVVSTGNALPATNYVTVAEANSDDHEGTLTTVSGTFAEIQDYTTSKNMILTSGTDSAIVKVWPTTGIDPANYTIGNEYSITGVGSQYAGEYQLLVGYASDIQPYNAICDDCTPTEFGLSKAYPNPFNPSTTIEFSLTEATDFNIVIYNITGQRVGVLASGYAEPGVYKQVWNASDFTSGVYFLRLEAGANIATQKVVLIK